MNVVAKDPSRKLYADFNVVCSMSSFLGSEPAAPYANVHADTHADAVTIAQARLCDWKRARKQEGARGEGGRDQ